MGRCGAQKLAITVKRNDFQPLAIHYLISTDGWLILFRNNG